MSQDLSPLSPLTTPPPVSIIHTRRHTSVSVPPTAATPRFNPLNRSSSHPPPPPRRNVSITTTPPAVFPSLDLPLYHAQDPPASFSSTPSTNPSTPSPRFLRSPSSQQSSFADTWSRPISTLFRAVRLYFSSMLLLRWKEYFISVDQSFFWRRSLVWSHDNGALLKQHLTTRFNTTSLVATLLLSAEITVLFSPSDLAAGVRGAMNYQTLGYTYKFFVGLTLVTSIFLTIATIISTYTAFALVGAISERNVHCVLRSAIGLYATQLPTAFLTASIFSFIVWMAMFIAILLPSPWWEIYVSVIGMFFLHIFITFSIFGRIILHSNAMSEVEIFNKNEEETMGPADLFEALLELSKETQHVPVNVQYRKKRAEYRTSQIRNSVRENVMQTQNLAAALRDSVAAGREREKGGKKSFLRQVKSFDDLSTAAARSQLTN